MLHSSENHKFNCGDTLIIKKNIPPHLHPGENDYVWVTRVPETIAEAKNLIEKKDEEVAWVEREERDLFQKMQKTGNCSWDSLQAGFLALLYMISDEFSLEKENAKKIYKEWNRFADEYLVMQYLQNSEQKDLEMLRMIYEKAKRKTTAFETLICHLTHLMHTDIKT
jgi:transposase